MQTGTALVCIGAILAVLASGVWATAETRARVPGGVLRRALTNPVTVTRLRALAQPPALAVGPVLVDTDARVLDPATVRANAYLPETFATVVLAELEFIKYKLPVLQCAFQWLESGGVLVLVQLEDPRSLADLNVIVRKGQGVYSTTMRYKGERYRTSRPYYPESDAVVQDMAETAGFVLQTHAFPLWVFVKP